MAAPGGTGPAQIGHAPGRSMEAGSMDDVTRIRSAVERGDTAAGEQLLA
jgi:hypothetical protein